jgi:hypothetical protein
MKHSSQGPRGCRMVMCLVALVLCGGRSVAAQPCTLVPLQPHNPGPRLTVGAIFDEDGPGGNPARFFAGGDFSSVLGESVRIARWDGVEWTAIAGAPAIQADAMTVYDDGAGRALYVGAGRDIWRYSGASWSVVAIPGLSQYGGPLSFAVLDPDGAGPERGEMFVRVSVGVYEPSNPSSYSAIYGFNGAQWRPLPPLPRLFKLLAYDADGPGGPQPPALYAYGVGLRRYDNGHWTVLADQYMYHATVFTPQLPQPGAPLLCVSGAFGAVGLSGQTIPAARVAAWDGAAWRPLGGGVRGASGDVRLLATWDPDGAGPRPRMLAAAGTFTKAAGGPADHLAFWDGERWHDPGQSFGSVNVPYPVFSLMRMFDADGAGPEPPHLIVSGYFGAINGQLAGNTALWRDGEWDQLGPGPQGPVFSLSIFNDGHGQSLFAAGVFARTDDIVVNNIARWDGQGWNPLGLGIRPTSQSPAPHVRTTLVHNDGAGWGLYAAGRFGMAGERAANNIARWRARTWEPIGPGLEGGEVYALVVHDADGPGPLPPRLYAGGSFVSSAGAPVRRLGVWNGVSWSEVGGGVVSQGAVRGLRSWDGAGGGGSGEPALYIGGDEMSVDGLPGNVAFRLTAAGWESLPQVPFATRHVNGFALHDQGEGWRLFALGRFVEVRHTGNFDRSMLRLDSGQWTTIASDYGPEAFVGRSLDPGRGRVLLTGMAALANDPQSRPTGRFPVTRSITPPFDDGNGQSVFFGGSSTKISYNGSQSITSRIARMRTCSACWANCDGSTVHPILNVDDFSCFINRFAAGDPWANCDNSTVAPVLNVDDFACFINRFAAGCP